MIKLPALYLALLFVTITNAQQKTLVFDREQLFTADEIIRLDSMLQEYRRSTGKIILISSDTLDISLVGYGDSLVKQFVTDSMNKPYLFMLLISRKNQLMFASVNDKVRPFATDALLFEILNAGIPSFKEKRRAEGAMLICKKAMEFLNSLAGK